MTRLATISPETAQISDEEAPTPSSAAAAEPDVSGVTVTEIKHIDDQTHVGLTSYGPLPEKVTLEALKERQATQGCSGP